MPASDIERELQVRYVVGGTTRINTEHHLGSFDPEAQELVREHCDNIDFALRQAAEAIAEAIRAGVPVEAELYLEFDPTPVLQPVYELLQEATPEDFHRELTAAATAIALFRDANGSSI